MMNILIISNNDACRSRMAMEILTSFGRGMKVFTAGVLPGNGIPDTVFSVMEMGIICPTKSLWMWSCIVISLGIMW